MYREKTCTNVLLIRLIYESMIPRGHSDLEVFDFANRHVSWPRLRLVHNSIVVCQSSN